MNLINFYKYIPFIFRKRFKKKYIVIESDDWGMELSISIDGINYIKKKYGIENFTRWTTDSLETVEDITLLFDLLSQYKNRFTSPPVITANFITHNIDYNNSDSLSFIPLTVHLKEKPDIIAKYRKGINDKIFHPQLHGYCHYDTSKLISFYLSDEGRELFNIGFLSGKSTIRGNLGQFRSEFSKNNVEVKNKLTLAIEEFYNLFNFYPKSIIPSHFILDRKYFEILVNNGIKAIQASNRLINSSGRRYRKIYFRKQNGFIWIPRNARLDPHPDYNFNSESCIFDIELAFKYDVPAVIDFHRVNIAGRYNNNYRDKSLEELKKVLSYISKHWPDVKFITSEELLKICK